MPQDLKSHTRFDPPFHFVIVPILLGNFLWRMYELVRHFVKPDGAELTRLIWAAVFALGLLLLMFKTRLYALKVQDRLIRLEERLRMMTVLPENLRGRVSELSEAQFIALRFAPDSELTELVRAAVEKKFSPKEIKAGIRNWRADDFRV